MIFTTYWNTNKYIESSKSIRKWYKLVNVIINGNKYIGFNGKEINSKYNINEHLLFVCWPKDI